jgi:NTP pyrophosphatase (non-canonical NTP hydrolase)
MIDLKQKQLKEWQDKNFPRSRYEQMTKDQLIDFILLMQFTLGMAEEIGEVAHHILKGIQGIREGVDGIDKKEVADGVVDSLIFGQQLLSELKVDAEKEIEEVTEKVLQRNWVKNPESGEKIFHHRV